MKGLALVCPASTSSALSSWAPQSKSRLGGSRNNKIFSCLKAGVVDGVLLKVFRTKMVEEVGWDSHKPGYDRLIEVANRMMLKNQTNALTKEAAIF